MDRPLLLAGRKFHLRAYCVAHAGQARLCPLSVRSASALSPLRMRPGTPLALCPLCQPCFRSLSDPPRLGHEHVRHIPPPRLLLLLTVLTILTAQCADCSDSSVLLMPLLPLLLLRRWPSGAAWRVWKCGWPPAFTLATGTTACRRAARTIPHGLVHFPYTPVRHLTIPFAPRLVVALAPKP